MLDIQDIRVELDAETGTVRAIDGMTLPLRRGETFALVGESGCGKSMTALALMRLLPENGQVVSGTISLGGQDLLALPERQMRQVRGGRIGMIFQEPSTSLNPVMTVGSQMLETIEAHTALRGAAARQKAIDWLRRVGIPEPERRIDDYPFRMSGGQKQRVMIAMTLAAEPDFIVADEPTTALDVTIQAQVLDLLKQLQAETGLGLLLITHDLAVVSGMAHRVGLMYAGQLVELADAGAFFARPLHPYAGALLQALPDARRRGQGLAAIPGTVPPLTQHFEGCRFASRCDQAGQRCHREVPQLSPAGAGRQVRCWLHVDGGMPAAAAMPATATGLVAAQPVDTQTAGSAAPLLTVRELKVDFPLRQGWLQRGAGFFHAVQGVSFDVKRGETLALVGESGCGKTTTGKALVQLLRHVATVSGQALMEGQNLNALQGGDLLGLRRKIQIIFQDPFASLNPRMRVRQVLEEGLITLRPDFDAAQRRQRIESLVDQVGLRKDALDRYPHEFSGGQRQRIAIARALAVEPQLIVCDEPTSALDVSVQAQILNLLKDLQRSLGMSYLFITHNIGVVEYIADTVAVMQRGRIVEYGPVQQVLTHPQQDYTRELIASVPRLVTG
ncbi:ABC transporter ATP-binding protein [Ideonella livida]|uniref:ABC transporter ATP-binding protein n=1 Tax=Ideonella livida TaxID=2707176 RepID=A0A7C9TI45_9BURK|nr:dipeptide ABC transporter ATP-binding protein [Ideonella livida]NDY90102.1 ABC transporter ATP-binding protein [Ideonella livida]